MAPQINQITYVPYSPSNRVGILFGAVTWPNEQDIAPETLLAEMLPVDQND